MTEKNLAQAWERASTHQRLGERKADKKRKGAYKKGKIW
jgi:hypothetical protein